MNDRVAVRLEHLVKEYEPGARAVDDVTLDVPRGAFVVILGPSGCGKTTLLKSVNRLQEPTSGKIFVDGVDAIAQDATILRRRIGYVIQQVGLFPHMTVAENVAVVPRLLRWPAAKIDARIDELLDLVNLEPATFRSRYPRQLSGGQQQRVGLARALAADPAILLMDEPFGAVDAIEREHLQVEVASLNARLHKTVLFVTHDVDEALRLADAIVVMRAGRVEQYAAPLQILSEPADEFVARLVGADDVLRRFALMKIESLVGGIRAAGLAPARATIASGASAREALALMLTADADTLTVVDSAGTTLGTITIEMLKNAARRRKVGENAARRPKVGDEA